MDENRKFGFCDLSIVATGRHNIKETIIKGLKFGYETFAIDTVVSLETSSSKISKKGSQKEVSIPIPQKLEITKEELQKHNISKKPNILSRLTVKLTESSFPFIHKVKDTISKYDIIAFAPVSEAAFKQLCQSNIELDIISFNSDEFPFRPSRKMLKLAIKNDVYFEIPYAPCIRSSVHRQRLIQISHDLFRVARSLNVIMSSGAEQANDIRNPYDVANLGVLFGLTPAASKGAVSWIAADLLYCARMRRTGASKCSAQICTFEKSTKKGKYSSLTELEDLIEQS